MNSKPLTSEDIKHSVEVMRELSTNPSRNKTTSKKVMFDFHKGKVLQTIEPPYYVDHIDTPDTITIDYELFTPSDMIPIVVGHSGLEKGVIAHRGEMYKNAVYPGSKYDINSEHGNVLDKELFSVIKEQTDLSKVDKVNKRKPLSALTRSNNKKKRKLISKSKKINRM